MRACDYGRVRANDVTNLRITTRNGRRERRGAVILNRRKFVRFNVKFRVTEGFARLARIFDEKMIFSPARRSRVVRTALRARLRRLRRRKISFYRSLTYDNHLARPGPRLTVARVTGVELDSKVSRERKFPLFSFHPQWDQSLPWDRPFIFLLSTYARPFHL